MKTLKAILLSSVVGLAIASPAFAQTQDGPAATTLEEVVVTAERSASNLQKTPVAVSAFSGETLTQRGASSLREVADSTPNLIVGNRNGLGSAFGSFSIRGIGVSARDSSPGVGVYVDDVYYSGKFGSILGLFDTERVEILRGPQGTLFGRNTIGGAVQYITPTPRPDFGGYVVASGGDYSKYGLQAVLNVPVTSTLAARIALGANNVGGYVDDRLAGIARGAEETRQGRLRLFWTPTSKLSVDLNVQGVTFKNNGRAAQVIGVNTLVGPGGGTLANAAFGCCRVGPLTTAVLSSQDYTNPGFNAPDFADVSFNQNSLAVTYDLTDDITFKSITANSLNRTEIARDFDNTPLAIIGVDDGLLVNKLFTQELQLQGHSFAGHLDWTVGGYYYNGDDTQSRSSQQIGTLPKSVGGDIVYTDDALAFYGQATYHLNDQWSVTAGVRSSKEDVSGQVVTPTVKPLQEASFDDVSPAFGVNYQMTEDTLLYAKASKGFRAGGIVVSSNLPAPGSVSYDQETAWTYEAGIRTTLLDNRLRVNLTGFRTDWKNIQFSFVNFAGTGPVPVVLNAGDADLYGFELESQLAVTRNFNLWAAVSTLSSEYKRIDPRAVSLITLDTELQRAPKLKYAFGGSYKAILPGDVTLTSNLSYSWTDSQRSSASISDGVVLDSYGLVNGRMEVRFKDQPWSVAVSGTNLTDEFYYGSALNVMSAGGTIFAEVARPREFNVSLRYDF